MTTYTILNRHGEVLASGLELESAAKEVLTYDGHQFEIRKDDTGWLTLYVSQFSENSTLGGRPLVASIYSGTTEAGIWTDVCLRADQWDNQRVLSDESYAEELAAIDQ